MIGDRRRRVEVDGLAVGAERRDELVVHDLDDHLAGRDRLDDGGADRFLAHLVGERAHDVERDVGFEQRAAHLAHRRVDIGLAERAAARQPIENAAKPFRQIVEHAVVLSTKHVCARGRTALSGVDLRPQGPVGGSKRSLSESWPDLKRQGPKVKEWGRNGPFLGLNHGRLAGRQLPMA